MEKALQLIKQIRNDLHKDWTEELEDYDLLNTLQSVYNLPDSIEDRNRIVCYICYAYSPDSKWLNLQKDRIENKIQILSNLSADVNANLYQQILYNKNEIVNISIFNYLEQLKTWKWRVVFDLLEYASRMSRFASQDTEEEKTWDEMGKEGEKRTLKEDIDISVIVKVNKEKGLLLQQSIEKREQADKMIEDIKREFVSTDHATQTDFGFQFSDTAKKRDIMSWRAFIKDLNAKKKDAIT